ncbi:MAG: hydantoinase/oxoprolinase family protein, partial [Nocardioidaceae bacterium]
VRVPVPGGPLTQRAAAAVAVAFHDEHRRLYGYDLRSDRRQEVEWVNLRVTGIGPIPRPQLHRRPAGVGPDPAVTGTRQVYFEDWTAASLYDRSRLGHGDVVVGPAVIEEFSSTIPVHPGCSAQVDEFGNLLITKTGCADE